MQNTFYSWYARLIPRRRAISPHLVRSAREEVSALLPAVVITGGSRGIGLALAECFLKSGHRTAIVARNAMQLSEAAEALKAATGFEPVAVLCDVSEPNAMDVIDASLAKAGLYLDVLVNNAGLGLAGPFVENSQADLSRLIAINVETVTRLTRQALPRMLARQRGGILNMASLGASIPGPYQAAYYASKAYVTSLTEAVASEVAGQGVRVAAVLPGPVNTAFHEAMGAEQSLYRWLLPQMSPQAVAQSTYRAFMLGDRIIVPGPSNSFFYAALRLMPHPVTVPLMRWLLRRSET
jgi:short-subunit dehydrogenase